MTGRYLRDVALQVPGLDLSAWEAAQSSRAVRSQVQGDQRYARTLGFNTGPILVVSGPHGTRGVVGFVPYATVLALVNAVG